MFCPDAIVWGTVGQWAGAIATTVAVVVALFRDAIVARYFPPKLVASLLSTEGERNILQYPMKFEEGMDARDQPGILQASTQGIPSRFFHIRVQNAKSWPRATKVRLNLVKVEARDSSGALYKMWSGDIPMSAKNEDLHPMRDAMGPPVDFDVVSADSIGWFHLHTKFNYFLLPQHTKAPMHRRLTFVAVSDEAVSNEVAVEVSWDGVWADDWETLKAHLVVK